MFVHLDVCTIKHEKCAFSDCDSKAPECYNPLHCEWPKKDIVFRVEVAMEPCCCIKNHKPHTYKYKYIYLQRYT